MASSSDDFSGIQVNDLSRVNVIGTSGCGKSTFSKSLAGILRVPYVQIDQIFWKPDWQEPTNEEFFPKLESAIAGDKWVLDGNYNRSLHLKWKKIQLVIWLDYSFAVAFYRVFTRAMYRSIIRHELWEGTGNKESFKRSLFSKESIILWTMQTHGSNRKRYNSMMQDKRFAHIQFLRLSSPKAAERFLCHLEKARS
jgi:adenylate kinase family enzyme